MLCAELCLVAQSCLTLCNPMDHNLSGTPVHGDSPGKNTGGVRCIPPGDVPKSGIESTSPPLAGRFFTTSATWEAHVLCTRDQICQHLDFVLCTAQPTELWAVNVCCLIPKK